MHTSIFIFVSSRSRSSIASANRVGTSGTLACRSLVMIVLILDLLGFLCLALALIVELLILGLDLCLAVIGLSTAAASTIS
jgi:hypothetical protein